MFLEITIILLRKLFLTTQMSNTCRLFFFLIAVLGLHSCVENFKQERAIIRQAESLMQDQPDSALHLLQGIDRHTLRGETLARYALIYSISQDKSGLDVSNDSLLRIAYEYYSQHPKDSLYARSQYYMGKYLWLTEQTDSAYNCLLKAKTASEADHDYYTAYLATDRMRRIAWVSDTALCLTLAKEAYNLYVKHGVVNPVNEVYLLIGIGDSYDRRREQDSTIYYYNIAFNKAKSSGDSIAIASVLQNTSRYYLYSHQNEKALDYAQQALRYKGYYELSLLKLFASCYTETGDLDKAQQYLNALPPAQTKETQLVRLRMRHRLSSKMGDADAAQEYFDSACDVAADMYLATQKDKLELHRKNMHEAMQRQQAEYQRTIFVICFLFSVALIILISWLFIKYRRTKRKEIANNEFLLGQTRNYVKKLLGFQQKTGEKDQKRHLILDSKDWDEIEAYLDVCSNSFVTRFRQQFPSLSEKDYHLCLLLRFGFSNPDLEEVYSISTQGIKNRQRIIKEKIGVVDKEVSLRRYIQRF
jgi:hypothetical protein